MLSWTKHAVSSLAAAFSQPLRLTAFGLHGLWPALCVSRTESGTEAAPARGRKIDLGASERGRWQWAVGGRVGAAVGLAGWFCPHDPTTPTPHLHLTPTPPFRPIDRPTHRPTDRSVDRPIDRPTDPVSPPPPPVSIDLGPPPVTPPVPASKCVTVVMFGARSLKVCNCRHLFGSMPQSV